MKTLLSWALMLGVVATMPFAHAEQTTQSPYETMYKRILMPEKVFGDDIIEVSEVFLYTCPHCRKIHPFAEDWKKSIADQKDVVFNLVPAIFSERNTPLAKAYYVAKELGREDLHETLFTAIHVKGQRISTKKQIKAFFIAQGIEADAFEKTYENSFGVDNGVRTSHFLTAAYGITGVPSLIVNGKYMILSSKTKGYKQMFDVVNYLIEKERKLIAKEKAKKAATQESKEVVTGAATE